MRRIGGDAAGEQTGTPVTDLASCEVLGRGQWEKISPCCGIVYEPRKRKEQELKMLTLSQQSSKQTFAKPLAGKEEEVSQGKPDKSDKLELKMTNVEPPLKQVEMLLHPKAMDALQELHKQQTDNLMKQRLAPIPLVLEQQFSEKLPYGDIPVAVPRSVDKIKM